MELPAFGILCALCAASFSAGALHSGQLRQWFAGLILLLALCAPYTPWARAGIVLTVEPQQFAGVLALACVLLLRSVWGNGEGSPASRLLRGSGLDVASRMAGSPASRRLRGGVSLGEECPEGGHLQGVKSGHSSVRGGGTRPGGPLAVDAAHSSVRGGGTSAFLGGAAAGLWSLVLTAQGLPTVLATVFAALLALSALLCAVHRPGFALPRFREEALVIVFILALAVALVPGVLEGWQQALGLAAIDLTASAEEAYGASALLIAGLFIILGCLYASWKHR